MNERESQVEEIVEAPQHQDPDRQHSLRIDQWGGRYRVLIGGKELQNVSRVEFDLDAKGGIPEVKLHVIVLDAVLDLDEADMTIQAISVPRDFSRRRILHLTPEEEKEWERYKGLPRSERVRSAGEEPPTG